MLYRIVDVGLNFTLLTVLRTLLLASSIRCHRIPLEQLHESHLVTGQDVFHRPSKRKVCTN